MESFPIEDWELARANIISWASDLSSAHSTKDIRAVRDRIYALGNRIDDMTRLPAQDEDSDPPNEEAQDEEPPSIPEPQLDEEIDDEVPEIDPKYVENETTVRYLSLSFLQPLT
jgi:hypothetical protein